jgi:cytochrome c5
MRQSLVNRSVLVLSGVFVGACIAFAFAVDPGSRPAPETLSAADQTPEGMAPAADVTAGARLYEARCERCHTLEESLAPLLEAESGSDARAAYLAMLHRHRKSSAEEDGPITDYLLSQLHGADATPSEPTPR